MYYFFIKKNNVKMEEIINSVYAQWGIFSIIVLAAGYIIFDNIKNNRTNNKANDKLDFIMSDVSSIKSDIPSIKQQIHLVEKEVDIVNQKVDEKIDFYVENISNRIDKLEEKVDKQPNDILNGLDIRTLEATVKHNKQMINQISLAPKLHKTMGKYIDRIDCDHIFLGLFHNGTSSTAGIPFYKFDVVAEKFNPKKVKRDVEFAHMYKDVDILRHNRLPIELVQNEMVHYVIGENNQSVLMDIDDILYRRMVGRDIKQLAINLLKDKSGNPMGFIGCVKYDYEELNFEELKNCALELEKLYE